MTILALCASLSQGCKKEPISVYSVPKESAPVAAASPAKWELPAGWVEQQAGGMRVGSFLVKGDEGQTADVSVIPLAGTAGSDLDNVNRWRGQIGMQPVDADGYAAIKEAVTIDGKPGSLVDLAGVDPNSNQATRILGTIARVGESAWFFKMIGPEELVAKEKTTFVQFLKAFTFPNGSVAPTIATAAPTSIAPAAPVATANAAPGTPKWEIPASWKPQAPSSMLLAKFVVEGADLGNAEVTISAFPGDVGGLPANVNRWRRQLGLEAMSEDNLPSVTSAIDVDGQKATLVDLISADSGGSSAANRLLVGVVPNGGQTWFFKMLGSDRIVDRERPEFMKFLQSIRFSHDH